ncbi:MAG: RNA-binding domain-containing protein [Candidatus Helarchaeota archaeon]
MLNVRVEAPFNNTESFEKIKKAINTLFIDADCKVELDGVKKKVVANLEGNNSLSVLYNAFRSQQILDVARRMMLKEQFDDCFVLYFNKQAAYVGKIHFSLVEEESKILGPIKIIVKSENIEEIIDYLAPETIDGKIIES